MASMGSLGNYGMNAGMGKGGVGGMQAGPNVSAAGMGPGPISYPTAYANMGYPANPAPVAPAYVAGVGVAAPVWNATGTILVLYILLVIITRCVFI